MGSSRVSHQVRRKERIPEQNQPITSKQNLTCLTCGADGHSIKSAIARGVKTEAFLSLLKKTLASMGGRDRWKH